MAFRTYRPLTSEEVNEAALATTTRPGSKRFGSRYGEFLGYVHDYMAAETPDARAHVVHGCNAAFGANTAETLREAANRIERAARLLRFGGGGTDPHAYLGDGSHRSGYLNRHR